MNNDAQADAKLANDLAAAGVAWTAAEALAATQFTTTMAAAMVSLIGSQADDQHTYDYAAALAEFDLSTALATAEYTRDTAYADASLAQNQADWPAWVKFENAATSIGAAYVAAVGVFYKDYQVAVDKARADYVNSVALTVHDTTISVATGHQTVMVGLVGWKAYEAQLDAATKWNWDAQAPASNWRNTAVGPDILDLSAQFSAGVADTLTMTLSTRFNSLVWGNLADQNHQGDVFHFGQGVAHDSEA